MREEDERLCISADSMQGECLTKRTFYLLSQVLFFMRLSQVRLLFSENSQWCTAMTGNFLSLMPVEAQ